MFRQPPVDRTPLRRPVRENRRRANRNRSKRPQSGSSSSRSMAHRRWPAPTVVVATLVVVLVMVMTVVMYPEPVRPVQYRSAAGISSSSSISSIITIRSVTRTAARRIRSASHHSSQQEEPSRRCPRARKRWASRITPRRIYSHPPRQHRPLRLSSNRPKIFPPSPPAVAVVVRRVILFSTFPPRP